MTGSRGLGRRGKGALPPSAGQEPAWCWGEQDGPVRQPGEGHGPRASALPVPSKEKGGTPPTQTPTGTGDSMDQ